MVFDLAGDTLREELQPRTHTNKVFISCQFGGQFVLAVVALNIRMRGKTYGFKTKVLGTNSTAFTSPSVLLPAFGAT